MSTRPIKYSSLKAAVLNIESKFLFQMVVHLQTDLFSQGSYLKRYKCGECSKVIYYISIFNKNFLLHYYFKYRNFVSIRIFVTKYRRETTVYSSGRCFFCCRLWQNPLTRIQSNFGEADNGVFSCRIIRLDIGETCLEAKKR